MKRFFKWLFHKHDKFYLMTSLQLDSDYGRYTSIRWHCLDCNALGTDARSGCWIQNPFGKIKRVELTPEEWGKGMNEDDKWRELQKCPTT